jgi:insertion element IS1 protein InsB
MLKGLANTPWGWLAMATQPRPSMAVHGGDRRHESAQQLWAHLPAVSRAQATVSTDPETVSSGIMPVAQHQAITQHARHTNSMERCNNTLRQRVCRLVRAPLACSNKLGNHLGAIQYFICHYTLPRAVALLVSMVQTKIRRQ